MSPKRTLLRVLTSDRFFRCLTLDRSASPSLPTTPVPDPRFSHAELTPSKFLSLRLPWHSCFFEQIFQPARDAVAENAGAGPGVPPCARSVPRLRACAACSFLPSYM